MKLCYVSSRFPVLGDRGDRARAYYQIQELSKTHEIVLICFDGEEVNETDYARMRRWCQRIEIIPFSRYRAFARMVVGMLTELPFQILYYRDPLLREHVMRLVESEKVDVIHASLIRVLPAVENIAGVPILIDFMDSFALGLKTRERQSRGFVKVSYRVERARLERYERFACARYPYICVTSPRDQDYLSSASVINLPQGVDLDAFSYRDEREGRDCADVVMTGNMGYQPNVDAVVWFAKKVWPLVLSRRPESTFRIVGRRPAPEVRKLARCANVTVVGAVSDMAVELHAARTAVSPVRCGAGIQEKVLEAMAAGTPVVATPFANSAVRAIHAESILLAGDAACFAESLLRLLGDSKLCRRIARAARYHIEEHFSWRAHADNLRRLYAHLISAPVKDLLPR